MDTYIDTNPQGTPEWFAARVGRITGSKAHLSRKVGCLTKQQAAYVAALQAGKDQAEALLASGYKKAPTSDSVQKALAGMPVGEWGDGSKKYAFRLAVERITGQPLDEGFQGNFFSKRGKRLESEARMIYELRNDVIVDEVGAICTTDGKFAASADGLIEPEDGWECKAFLDPSLIMPMILDGDFSEIRDQCLMGLWLSGRKRWHATLYVPALEVIGRDLTVHTIDRRAEGVEDEITRLEEDLMALDGLVEHYRARLLAGAEPADYPGMADEAPKPKAAQEPMSTAFAVAPGDLATLELF